MPAFGCAEVLDVDAYRLRDCTQSQIDDGEGGCIEVPECAANELPVPGGTCRKIGVADCGEGFEPDPDVPRGCRPILPDCGGGPIVASLGAPTCARGFPCSLDDEVPTYVETAEPVWVSAYAREPFMGTRDQPYRTIGDAIAAASPGMQITVLRGMYEEHVRIPYALRLQGACTEETEIVGPPTSSRA